MSSITFRKAIDQFTPSEAESDRAPKSQDIRYMRSMALAILSHLNDVADLPFDENDRPVVTYPLIEHMMLAPALNGDAESIAGKVRQRIIAAHRKTTF